MQTIFFYLFINLFTIYLTSLSALHTSYVMLHEGISVNNEFEKMWKDVVVASICLECLRKTTIKSQDSQAPGRDPPNIKNNGHNTLGCVTIVQCWWRYQDTLSSSTYFQLVTTIKVRQILGARGQGTVTKLKLYFVIC